MGSRRADAAVWLRSDGQLPTSALATCQVVDPDEEMKRGDEHSGVGLNLGFFCPLTLSPVQIPHP